jgi:hypothetical protein
MKTIIAIFSITLLSVNRSSAEWTAERRRIESEQVAMWEQKLTEARAGTAANKTAQLWLGLRNMGHRNSIPNRSPEVQVIYEKIQDELLSTPGHAKYLALEIKREQKEVANYATSTGPRVEYDFNRARYFKTLARLPSPETIAVLGEFLSDDIDTPRPLNSPHSDWGENPRANSFGASFTIAATGLRDAPADKKSYDLSPEEHLAKTRAWWEEVKSGKRAFSFMGQAVEYRFKADGTWDTIPIANPPDDAPKQEIKKVDEKPIKVPEQSEQHEKKTYQWLLVAVGVLLCVVCGLWMKRKMTVSH